MEQKNMSPLPQKVMGNDKDTISTTWEEVKEEKKEKTMDFPEAMRAVMDGKRITKLEWGTKAIHGLIDEEILKIRKEDGKLYRWIISSSDGQGRDWAIV